MYLMFYISYPIIWFFQMVEKKIFFFFEKFQLFEGHISKNPLKYVMNVNHTWDFIIYLSLNLAVQRKLNNISIIKISIWYDTNFHIFYLSCVKISKIFIVWQFWQNFSPNFFNHHFLVHHQKGHWKKWYNFSYSHFYWTYFYVFLKLLANHTIL